MKRIAIAAGTVVLLAGCASGASDDAGADDAPAQANAAGAPTASVSPSASAQGACAPFPAGNIPPSPTPPYNPPYGDPQQPASLAALQAAVVQAAQDPAYSKSAVMCAEGMSQPEVCDVDYWNTGGLPGTEEYCNFYYLRVGDEYWSNGANLGLTPMVLAQYGGYLGVIADGQDAQNQAAGPHTTIAEYNGAWVNVGQRGSQAAAFTTVNGKLDPADAAAQLTQAVRQPVTGGTGTISPIIAADRMTVDCSTVWRDTGSSWQQTTLDQIAVTPGTGFVCRGTGDGVGTAYIEAKLLPGADSGAPTAPAAVSIRVPSNQSNTLRADPAGPFTADNVVWPTGSKEVTSGTSIQFTIPTGDVCPSDTGGPAESCLHLWVNFPSNEALTVGPQQLPGEPAAANDGLQSSSALACTIWFTLELQSPELLSTMTGYGLSTQGYTPHISLAKKKWQRSDIGPPSGTAAGKPDPCNDARLLASGQPGTDPFNPNP